MRAASAEAEPLYLDFEAQAAKTMKICRRFKLAAAGITLVSYPLSIALKRKLWSQTEQDLKKGRFDLVHRLTPGVSPRRARSRRQARYPS